MDTPIAVVGTDGGRSVSVRSKDLRRLLPDLRLLPESGDEADRQRWLRRVTTSNPEYARRAAFPLLEEILSGMPLCTISRALQDACPYLLGVEGLHARGTLVMKSGRMFETAGGNNVLEFDGDAETGIYEPIANSELSWFEFEADSSSFTESERKNVARFEEITGGALQVWLGVLVSIVSVNEVEREATARDEGFEGIQFHRHATCTAFTFFRSKFGASQVRQSIRPANFSVEIVWAKDKVYANPRIVRPTWAAPFEPIAADEGGVSTQEAEWTTSAVLAAIVGLNVFEAPQVAGVEVPAAVADRYPLLSKLAGESESFAKIIGASRAARVDLSAWCDWTGHGLSEVEKSDRLIWYGLQIPPEPQIPNVWVEMPIYTDTAGKPGEFNRARLGVFVHNWSREHAASKLGRIKQAGGMESDVAILDRDRWYICYLFGVDPDGTAYAFKNATAFGYGGGFPVGVHITLDQGAGAGGKFLGLPCMSMDFVANDEERKLPTNSMVASLATAAMSAISEPLADIDGDLAKDGFRFSWKGDERPNTNLKAPPQNWPDLRSIELRAKKAQPQPDSLPVWNLQKHLNNVAADAAVYEWAWKYGAVYTLTMEEQRAAREKKATPDGVFDVLSIGFNVTRAVEKAKAKSVRDPFDDTWPKKLVEWSYESPSSLLMWASFFGDGPKTFRPTLKEFDALRHVDCKFPASMYRQPFDTLAIEFPATIGDAWNVRDKENDCEARPVAMMIFKPHERPGLFTMLLYSTGMERVICMPLGMDDSDPEIETLLKRMIPEIAEPGESLDELRGVAELMRVGVNICFLLVQGGCRKIGFADPGAAAALRKQADAKKARPELKERARVGLISQPVVYGFHKTIKVYDEGSTYEPNAESAKAGYHVKPHWRRGCFVNQPYGENRSLRKTIYRRPQFINHHLFGGMQAATNVTLVRVPAGDEGKLPEVTR